MSFLWVTWELIIFYITPSDFFLGYIQISIIWTLAKESYSLLINPTHIYFKFKVILFLVENILSKLTKVPRVIQSELKKISLNFNMTNLFCDPDIFWCIAKAFHSRSDIVWWLGYPININSKVKYLEIQQLFS